MSKMAERLKYLRKFYKFTQNDVAKFLGISESGYGYYEQDRNKPPLESLIKLVAKYKVTMEYLTGESDVIERRIRIYNKNESPSEDHILFELTNEHDDKKLPIGSTILFSDFKYVLENSMSINELIDYIVVTYLGRKLITDEEVSIYATGSIFEHFNDYSYLEKLNRLALSNQTTIPLTTYPVGEVVKVPIIGRVKAGLDGTAIQEHIGMEITDVEDVTDGAEYRWLQVYGDSMIGEGIFEGDLALVRIQPDVENGELAVVIVNGENGALKRVYKKENSIVLQSANPAHPPRVFVGVEMNAVYIFGKVKVTKRRF